MRNEFRPVRVELMWVGLDSGEIRPVRVDGKTADMINYATREVVYENELYVRNRRNGAK